MPLPTRWAVVYFALLNSTNHTGARADRIPICASALLGTGQNHVAYWWYSKSSKGDEFLFTVAVLIAPVHMVVVVVCCPMVFQGLLQQ